MILEGWLKFRSHDGRELEALVVSAEHAARVVASWEAGECPERPQRAGGQYIQCSLEAGHEGRCK